VLSRVRGLASAANRALDHALADAYFDSASQKNRYLHQNPHVIEDMHTPPNLLKGSLDNALRKAGVDPRMAGTQLLELLLSSNG
jgi:hypothetical protein